MEGELGIPVGGVVVTPGAPGDEVAGRPVLGSIGPVAGRPVRESVAGKPVRGSVGPGAGGPVRGSVGRVGAVVGKPVCGFTLDEPGVVVRGSPACASTVAGMIPRTPTTSIVQIHAFITHLHNSGE